MSPLAPNTNPLVGSHEPPTKEPMLGVRTSIDPPRYLPIPPGAGIAVFTDPTNPDMAQRWVLEEVSANGKTWKLRCDCTEPRCTRRATVSLSYTGRHPSQR